MSREEKHMIQFPDWMDEGQTIEEHVKRSKLGRDISTQRAELVFKNLDLDSRSASALLSKAFQTKR